MRLGVIIKHPYRDYDYRIDIIEVPENTSNQEIRTVIEREMLGPFKVIAIVEKIKDRDISEGIKKLSMEIENHIDT